MQVELGRHGAGAGQTLTAYQAFFRITFNEMRAAARAEWQASGAKDKFNCPTNAIVKTIGERWRSMAPAQVEAFADRTGSVAPGKQRRGTKRKRRVPKPAKPAQHGPKRPMTAYQLFFREHEGQLSGKTPGFTRAEGMTQNMIVKTIGERWRALQHDPKARAVWTRREEEDKQRYNQQAAALGAGVLLDDPSLAGIIGGMRAPHDPTVPPAIPPGRGGMPPGPPPSLLARYQQLSAAAAFAAPTAHAKARMPPKPPT